MSSSISVSIEKSSPSTKHGLSSHTTSFPDLSSLSSSTNRSAIVDLKKKLNLLKTQLQQREKELEKQKWESDEQAIARTKTLSELQFMQIKSSALKAVCDDLTSWIESSEAVEKHRLEELEAFYKDNIKSLTICRSKLKAENSYLREEYNKSTLKVTNLTSEQEFLKSDRKSLQRQLNEIQKEHEEIRKTESEMKLKYTKLLSDYQNIKRTQKDKNNQELSAAIQNKSSQLEKVRRIHEDREKEYGLTLSRLQNEIDFLKSEINRKEMHCKRMTAISDKLSLDNKNLFEANADQKIQYDNELNNLRNNVDDMSKRLQIARKENKELSEKISTLNDNSTKNVAEVSKQKASQRETTAVLISAQEQITILEKQINEMKQLKQLSSSEIRNSLTEKSIRLIETERRAAQLSSDLKEEREQRENTTQLLLEMGNDMQYLLSVMKKYG